jgi:hypothetical protein
MPEQAQGGSPQAKVEVAITPTQQSQPPLDMSKPPEEWRDVHEVKRLISEYTDMKKSRRDLEARIQAYEAKDAERAARNERTRLESEQERLQSEGKFKEALGLTEQKYQKQIDSLTSRISDKFVPAAIAAAASKVRNLTPEAMRDLPLLLRDSLGFDQEKLEVYVRGADGKPMIDERLAQVGVDQFVQKFVAERPYLTVDSMPRTHGGGVGTGTKEPTFAEVLDDPKAASEWSQRDPEGYARAQKEYFSGDGVRRLAKARVAQLHKARQGGE